MSTGYIATLITFCCWTISIFIFARLTRLEDCYVLNRAGLFLTIFLLGIVVCVVDGLAPWQLFSAASGNNWLWLGVSGILGKSVGDYCACYGLRILGPRRHSIANTVYSGITFLLGLLILGEKMNWLGIAAMMLTTISLMLLLSSTTERNEVKQEKFGLPWRGVLYDVTACTLTALAFIFAKITLTSSGTNISAFHATWIRVITAFGALMIFDLVRQKPTGFIRKVFYNKRNAILLFFGITFGAVLGLSFFLMAYTRLKVAEASTILSLIPVNVLIISVIIYKKKVSTQSWLYSLLAVAGVIVLIWRDNLIKYFQGI